MGEQDGRPPDPPHRQDDGPGFDALILTTVGAKSGVERTNPAGWFPGSDGGWLIVASAAGAARNPAWYHNIAAHPGQVKIELDGRRPPRPPGCNAGTVAVTADLIPGL